MKQNSLFGPPQERTTGPAIRVNIDGGARGNPGPAAYGVVVRDPGGKIIDEIADYLGIQTNNFAEYSGLLAALEYALRGKYASVKVFSDSELLVKQMKGQYRVKNPGLLELYERARAMVSKLQHFSIEHVLRESNREADRLVNKVLDARSGGMRG